MASYEMDTTEDVKPDEGSKKISFRFCRECSNMLYPKEDQHNNQLMFSCRTCHYTEPATAACVYRNSLQEQIAETAGNVEDVAQDPTVGEYSNTATDSFMESEDPGFDAEGDVPETCTYCGKEILCPFCGAASDAGILLEVPDPNDNANAEQEEVLVEAERRERALSSASFAAS